MSLNVQGQLKGAQVENLGSDPSNLPHGRAWYNTVSNKIKMAISGVARALLTEDGSATVTNKDIDGGTASNSNRITVPKNTKANLDALTRKAGTVVYGTDTLTAYFDNGTALIPPLSNPMTTGGDIIYGGASGVATRLANGSSGQMLQSNGGTSAPSYRNAPFSECLIVRDEKASGTDGGSSGSGAQTRVLNTVQVNTISGASLSSDQIVLPAGTYEIDASAPFFNGSQAKAYLYNVTDATTTVVGTSEYSASTGHVNSSRVLGRFTIAGTKTFELRQYILSAVTTNGLGVATSSGDVEVYSVVKITKV